MTRDSYRDPKTLPTLFLTAPVNSLSDVFSFGKVTADKEDRSIIAWSGHEEVVLLLKRQHQAMREEYVRVIIIQ